MDREREIKQYLKKVKEIKAKIMPQRVEILNILLNHRTEHLTAEEIIARLGDSKTGQATVYRTLELFCQAKILKKVNFKNEEFARYDLLDLNDKHFHHHLICNQCGKVIEINDDLLERLEEKLEKQYHFIINNHELVLRGVCEDCRCNGEKNEG